MSQTADTPSVAPSWRIAAWYGLFVMILVAMAGNLIPQIVALVTEPMKRDLSLSDTQIGVFRGLASTLVVAVASYPIAWAADRIDRRFVFVACMLLWSSATIAMGFSTSFETLFACAVGVAFGEAVLGPVTFAIIPDLFPPERRMIANSIFFISQLLGVAAGLALGGSLIQALPAIQERLPDALSHLQPWRVTIMAAALPTLALAPFVLLMRLTRRARPAAGQSLSQDSIFPFMRAHTRTLSAIFIGFGLLGAANFIPFSWLAILVIRDFHVPAENVGLLLAQVFAVGGVGGVLAANLLARLLAGRSRELTPIRVAQIGALAAALLCGLYLFANSPQHLYVIAALQLGASTGALVLSPTLTQNVTPARIRARVLAIGGLFYIGFGALSPVAVGFISDRLSPAGDLLLHAMLMVAIPAFVSGAAILQLGVKSLPNTLAAVKGET